MEILKICAVIVACAVLSQCIPASDRHISTVIDIAACAFVTVYAVNSLGPVFSSVKELAVRGGGYEFSLIFKVLGIGFISQFVSDVAADCGNKSLANLMLFAGRTACLVVASPLFLSVLDTIKELAGGI